MLKHSLLLLAVVSAILVTVTSYSIVPGNSIDDPDFCQLVLYRVQVFQGKSYALNHSRRRLKGLEKSLRIVGNCCWALYPRIDFQGRPTYLGGKIELESTSKWGWRRHGIRSAKRLGSDCDDSHTT